ncbi:MAG: winged helix-turn-helix transcriptional regulator [Thermoplasmata archaeon]|nr:winged helix-turn-helix transcriptional regulator [Thermoplasmata archaeon]
MADEIRVIDDPKIIKLLIDETRRAILELLRLNDLTVDQMASILEKDQSTIYRHVEKLLNAGIIEQTGEKKIHHIPKKMYGRTAKLFFLAPGADAVPEKDELLKIWENTSGTIATLLEQIGYEGDGDHAEHAKAVFLEIEKVVSEKMKDLKPDSNMSFYMVWKLQTAIMMLEMERDPELKKKIKEFIRAYD